MPTTTAASVAASTLVPAAWPQGVHLTSHGDGRTSWPPEPIHVPPAPPSLTEEIRRVLLALREGEAGQVMRYSSQPLHGRTRGDRRP
eukprot:796185-Pleurochrysis_carterae.AAC.1